MPWVVIGLKYWYGPIKAKPIIPECSAVNVQLFPLEKSSSSPEETCQSLFF